VSNCSSELSAESWMMSGLKPPPGVLGRLSPPREPERDRSSPSGRLEYFSLPSSEVRDACLEWRGVVRVGEMMGTVTGEGDL